MESIILLIITYILIVAALLTATGTLYELTHKNKNRYEMKYKIYKKHYHNELGKTSEPQFFIKKKKTFLGITYWRTITHNICFYDGCSKVPTIFKSENEAREFIKNTLCKDVPRQTWIESPVKELTCGNFS